jgi:hypothetical protein
MNCVRHPQITGRTYGISVLMVSVLMVSVLMVSVLMVGLLHAGQGRKARVRVEMLPKQTQHKFIRVEVD